MHYRIRGNSVQLVKPVVDESTGKTVSRPVGSANLSTGKLNERAQQSLGAEEIEAVQRWVANRQKLESQKRQIEARILPTTLANVAQWIREAEPDEVEAMADEIQFAISDLRRSLRRKLRAQAA